MDLKTNFVFLFVIILLYLFFINLDVYELIPRKNEVCPCEEIKYCFYDNIIDMKKLSKPKIFIHIEDRNNILGVCELCIESTLKYCSSKYDIILYTNEDAKNLIDDENDDLCNIENIQLLSGADLRQWEEYCRFKILHKYGGVVMKPYFLFSRCPEYTDFNVDKLKIVRVNNEGLNVSNMTVIPTSSYLIAAPQNDSTTQIYVEYLSKMCQNNYTSDFKYFDKSFEQLHHIHFFPEDYIGAVESDQKKISLERLLLSEPLSFSSKNYCLFINVDLLRKKRHYGWILRLSKEQISKTNTIIGKYANM